MNLVADITTILLNPEAQDAAGMTELMHPGHWWIADAIEGTAGTARRALAAAARVARRLARQRICGGAGAAALTASPPSSPSRWRRSRPRRSSPGRRSIRPAPSIGSAPTRWGASVLSRVLYGGRTAFLDGGVPPRAVTVATGGLFGLLLGYRGGLVDELAMRVCSKSSPAFRPSSWRC